MNTVYILLGANLGDPLKQIELSVNRIRTVLGTVCDQSSIYETDAWGMEDQPIFFNQVIRVETTLQPLEVLYACQRLENELGRVRTIKWGSRTIDIDILYFNDLIIDSEILTIPHPYIQERRFTLVPLCEIASDYIHPILHKSNKELLMNNTDPLTVKKNSTMNYQYIKPEIISAAMSNNTAMVRQFVEMYVEQSPLDFDKLAKGIETDTLKDIADAAHHIKPTMEYVGATELRLDFQEIEDLARQSKDSSIIKKKFDIVQSKFTRFIEELTDFSDNL